MPDYTKRGQFLSTRIAGHSVGFLMLLTWADATHLNRLRRAIGDGFMGFIEAMCRIRDEITRNRPNATAPGMRD